MEHSNNIEKSIKAFHILNKKALNFRYRIVSTENVPIFYHYHKGIEVLFVHRGKGTLTLNRKIYNLESGCVLILQPFQLHRVQFDPNNQCPYERTTLTFEPSTFAPFLKNFPVLSRFFEQVWKEQLSNQVFRMDRNTTYISSILERFHDMVSGWDEDEDLEAASILILNILDYLKSLHNGGFGGVSRPESHTEKIMNWVEEHYKEPFALDDLAKELHLSKHYVSHLFRSETGGSITEYVIARRIRQACWLLKTESKSVEHIGSLVGIPNSPYFCRLFKKITGLTPIQYRKSHLN
ncbi:AraC family transcriptional regulator [Paenibacillus radicis (ex Xue et al. 2023)]|uniref:AraC family transcriptional regulator n=1 Tax=Paenibacillus radicis (ex Xue et al. 2023) TaxID=2972489 RepID=A0ABT1YM02_9BACL|nr:AraC family transcriptional regulator [Paenibacillus radicis (ex Xue et al. 2023)]MCR8634208.1 AraC family transcriptional regulator [Paenibacillus radicis (ex Xue et al. 2023)]